MSTPKILEPDSKMYVRLISRKTGRKSKPVIATPQQMLDHHNEVVAEKNLDDQGEEEMLQDSMVDILFFIPEDMPDNYEPDFELIPLYTLSTFFELIFNKEFDNVS